MKMEHKKIAAGVLLIDKITGDLLLGKRAFQSNSPNTWSPFGGGFESRDGNVKNTAKREVSEESSINSDYEISKSPFYIQDNPKLTFYTFIGILDNKVPVKILDKEHTNYGWFPLDNLPSDLHPGFAELLSKKGKELEEIIKNLRQQNDNSNNN